MTELALADRRTSKISVLYISGMAKAISSGLALADGQILKISGLAFNGTVKTVSGLAINALTKN